MFKIEPIFIVFPLILLFAALMVKNKNANRAVFIISFMAYFVLFICSRNGSDYENYKKIFEQVSEGTSFEGIHGEKIFLIMMKVCSSLGFSYTVFRVAFLSIFTTIFLYSVYKLSPNGLFSFALMFMAYIVYLISAYRQFAVMAITIYCFYSYLCKGRKISPIILLAIGMFIHVSAILPLVYFIFIIIYYKVKGFNKINKPTICSRLVDIIVDKSLYIILCALLLRPVVYSILSIQEINDFMTVLIGYTDKTLFNFGLLSRTLILILVSISIGQHKKSKSTRVIFLYYFLSIIIYIIVPYETLMGRLMNNARIFDIILIPTVLSKAINIYSLGNTRQDRYRSLIYKPTIVINISRRLLQFCFISIVYIMFVYQLLFQNGYSPYINIFF